MLLLMFLIMLLQNHFFQIIVKAYKFIYQHPTHFARCVIQSPFEKENRAIFYPSFIFKKYTQGDERNFVSFSSCITIVIVPRSRSEIIKFSTKLFAASSHKFPSDEELLLSAREIPPRFVLRLRRSGFKFIYERLCAPKKIERKAIKKRIFIIFPSFQKNIEELCVCGGIIKSISIFCQSPICAFK